MIRATGLTKPFGDRRILDGLDLAVTAGQRVALLGLNGAGKTTLIRCLLGLVSFEGRLEVAGNDVRTRGREARARLGYVPQRAPQFDGTLFEAVEFFARLRGAKREAVHERLAALGLSLAEHGTKPVQALSGGMLQKVLLALALGEEVPLLLLDEPTANLDPRARSEFLRALRQVDRGTTVLLASHRLADVQAATERLLVLHAGRIVFDGTMPELWRQVGAATTLWVRVPPGARDAAREQLRAECRLRPVVANGAALGVRVEHAAGADVLVALRQAAIPVEDFWTESPSLHDLLDGILVRGGHS